jgi:hypothetical protein
VTIQSISPDPNSQIQRAKPELHPPSYERKRKKKKEIEKGRGKENTDSGIRRNDP